MLDPVEMLKAYRSANSLTQAELAKRVGVTEGYISMILSRYREPGPIVLKFLKLKKRVTTSVIYERATQS